MKTSLWHLQNILFLDWLILFSYAQLVQEVAWELGTLWNQRMVAAMGCQVTLSFWTMEWRCQSLCWWSSQVTCKVGKSIPEPKVSLVSEIQGQQWGGDRYLSTSMTPKTCNTSESFLVFSGPHTEVLGPRLNCLDTFLFVPVLLPYLFQNQIFLPFFLHTPCEKKLLSFLIVFE